MKPGVPELLVDIREERLTQIEADCAVVIFFDDQRPLRGGAGLVDWRLCGRLSALLERNPADGWVLLPSEGRLAVPRVLAGGLGTIHALDAPKLATFAKQAAERAVALKAAVLAWDLAIPGTTVAAESAATSVLTGFRDVLTRTRTPFELRFCAAPEEGLRWRVAVERAVARQPRGDAPLLVRTVTQAPTRFGGGSLGSAGPAVGGGGDALRRPGADGPFRRAQ